MSYSERLNDFNTATAQTLDHVQSIKDHLNDPKLRENPVALGLEATGSTLGSLAGVVGVKARMADSDVMRNVQKAFYNKLGGGTEGIADSINSGLKDNITDLRNSISSSIADGNSKLSQAVSQLKASPIANPNPTLPSVPSAPTAPAPTPAQTFAGRDITSELPVFDTQVQSAAQKATSGVTATLDQASNGARAGANAVANSVAIPTGGVPTPFLQASGVPVNNALGSASTAGSASGQAHITSQLQNASATAHQNATSAGNEATSNLTDQAQAQANRSANVADTASQDVTRTVTNGASNAANTADDVASNLKNATKVEETLDELAPDTGALAPMLEAGSLLATLGTSIASIFVSKDKEEAPAPAPAPATLSIGASLKQDSGGSVGAF